MTHTAAIIRQLDAPPLAKRAGIAADAIVADVDAIAAEWSVGNDLAMISAETVASRNAEALDFFAAEASEWFRLQGEGE